MTARAALDRDDEVNVTVLVGQGRQALEAMREHDPALAAMADRLAEIGYLATDLAVELVSYAENVEADPYRLAAVSERRAQLGRLMGRYGSTVDEVLSWSTTAHDRLLSRELTDDQVEALSDEVSSGREALTTLGRRLSQARHQAANELSSTVTSELVDLAMPDASFECSVVPEWDPADDATFGDDGIDDVTFRLRPHPDAPTLPLAKGASGGELSRVMLAIEVCLASVDTVPTFGFDEVDAGVGGQAAVEVGRRLAGLARASQVIVVPPLPQVAAFADQHLVVTKSRDGVVTRSDVTSLDQGSRSKELARMLAGLPDSAHGQKHAEELLELAAEAKTAAG
jgi:DNA repair protein RecN (Recombination protein N)